MNRGSCGVTLSLRRAHIFLCARRSLSGLLGFLLEVKIVATTTHDLLMRVERYTDLPYSGLWIGTPSQTFLKVSDKQPLVLSGAEGCEFCVSLKHH